MSEKRCGNYVVQGCCDSLGYRPLQLERGSMKRQIYGRRAGSKDEVHIHARSGFYLPRRRPFNDTENRNEYVREIAD